MKDFMLSIISSQDSLFFSIGRPKPLFLVLRGEYGYIRIKVTFRIVLQLRLYQRSIPSMRSDVFSCAILYFSLDGYTFFWKKKIFSRWYSKNGCLIVICHNSKRLIYFRTPGALCWVWWNFRKPERLFPDILCRFWPPFSSLPLSTRTIRISISHEIIMWDEKSPFSPMPLSDFLLACWIHPSRLWHCLWDRPG